MEYIEIESETIQLIGYDPYKKILEIQFKDGPTHQYSPVGKDIFDNYEPADKSEVLSMEFVEFNFSTKLSEMYTILGKVAKKIGNVYENSEDDTLNQLAKAYYTMEKEAKSLSKLVKTQLPEYDYQILENYAMLKDYPVNGGNGGDPPPPPPPPSGCFGGDPYWDCFWCEVAVGLTLIGLCVATIWWFPGAAAFCITALIMFLQTGSTTIVCIMLGCC